MTARKMMSQLRAVAGPFSAKKTHLHTTPDINWLRVGPYRVPGIQGYAQVPSIFYLNSLSQTTLLRLG